MWAGDDRALRFIGKASAAGAVTLPCHQHPPGVPLVGAEASEDDGGERVAYPRLSKMAAGDTITFNGEHTYRVVAVNRSPSFEAVLEAEDAARIVPEVTRPAALMSVLRSIYPPEKEGLGVLAIHLAPVSTASSGASPVE